MNRIGAIAIVVVATVSLALHPPSAGRATPAPDVAMHVLATTVGTLPSPGGDLIWLVQQGAVFGDRRDPRAPLSLGFALSRRGTLELLDPGGVTMSEIAAGRAAPLPQDYGGAFVSATGDLTLYLQIALLSRSALPPAPLPRAQVTVPFAAPAAGPVTLELLRGFINPGQTAVLPASSAPVLLVASDNPVRVARGEGDAAILVRDAVVLLDAASVIRNDGPSAASVHAARIVTSSPPATAAAPPGAAVAPQPLDPVVDEAWRRNSCHLNPGNAACSVVSVAAACATAPSDPACFVDDDGDGCLDVAEIRAAFDPFDVSDCLGNGRGAPVVNCLFPTQNIACHVAAAPPQDRCVSAARDPACDGFAPGRSAGNG